ncbi:hypothetical protein Q5M87_13440 [Brachyspira innocens]|uniref:TPR domain-containing protein n=1 Tax=Brachyspira innocens TaxID=13264 RepID=A0ABT8YZR8_9SPIR|nr:hypothetical protein [Brachyspira innocens]MDO6995011.1 hypothetical protein [Brachyspira innocens]MDO7021383.1 hypothetical protein [Brachyspira innocens]
MEFNLILPYENEIEASDKTEIDRYIESTIKLHKNNANKLTELTLEAASCLAAGEARAKQLSSQGFFKNLWGAITGKNRKIRGEIDYNFAVAQKASQRMIQVLAEQNKLTFEAVVAVNNKLNTMSVDINNQINEIYSVMKQMFQGLLGQIVQNSLKIEKLEQNVKLLNWNATIEYLTYDNRTYSSLDTFEKIICLSNDFYRMAGENRTTQDMLLLKTTMANCGIDINSKIKAVDFYRLLSSREDLIKRLFEDTKIENLEKALSYTIPISSGFRKLNLLAGEENYIVKSITSLSETSEEDIKVTLTKEYVKQHSDFDIEKEINIYEFAVMLVDDLGVIDSFADESEIIEAEEKVPLLAESNTIETLFEEGKYYKVIEECNKIIEFNENNEEANKEDLIKAYKYRAKCYTRLDNFYILDDIEKIQSINKNYIESYLIESDILIKDNELDKALEAIENGLEENNNNFELHKKKWEILFKAYKVEEVLESIDNYIKANGESFEVLRTKILMTDKFISNIYTILNKAQREYNRIYTQYTHERPNNSIEKFINTHYLVLQEFLEYYNGHLIIDSEQLKYFGIKEALSIAFFICCYIYPNKPHIEKENGVYSYAKRFIFKYLDDINRAILMNNNDYELYYLLAKYKYDLLTIVVDSLSAVTNFLNIVYIDDISSEDIKSYLKINREEVLPTLINDVDKSLALKPDYEEALLLKGLIYRIQKDNQALLTLRDEYIKQGFDPDKIFNKLFND